MQHSESFHRNIIQMKVSVYILVARIRGKIESTDDQKDHLGLSLNLKENENKYLIKCKKVSRYEKSITNFR